LKPVKAKMVKQLEFKVEIHLGKIDISGKAAHKLTTNHNKLYLRHSVGAKSDCRAKAETSREHSYLHNSHAWLQGEYWK
jgi:hypothetical protein